MALQGPLESEGKQGRHLDHHSEGNSRPFQQPSEALENAVSSMYVDVPTAQKHDAVCLTPLHELRALRGETFKMEEE